MSGETRIVLAADEEGNAFSPLGDVSQECYEAADDTSGELVPGPVNAVVLWPLR